MEKSLLKNEYPSQGENDNEKKGNSIISQHPGYNDTQCITGEQMDVDKSDDESVLEGHYYISKKVLYLYFNIYLVKLLIF